MDLRDNNRLVVFNCLSSVQTSEDHALPGSDCENNHCQKYCYGAVGELPNEEVPKCHTCKNRGYPNEPLKIQKILGKALSDGTNEILGHRLVNYITDGPHRHKEPKQQQGEGGYYMGWDLEAFD